MTQKDLPIPVTYIAEAKQHFSIRDIEFYFHSTHTISVVEYDNGLNIHINKLPNITSYGL